MNKLLKKHPQSDGFNAFGYAVPDHRMRAGHDCLKEMCPDLDTETRWAIIGKIAKSIKRDSPFDIVGATTTLDPDLAKVDVTGRYRLLATMCSAPNPDEK